MHKNTTRGQTGHTPQYYFTYLMEATVDEAFSNDALGGSGRR